MRIVLTVAVLSGLLLAASCVKEQAKPAPVAESNAPQAVDTVKVVEQKLERTVRLPGEVLPYEAVAVYPKVTGFVEEIPVDRGSRVRRGQLLARMSAPELQSQRVEAEAKLQAAHSQGAEAEAKLVSDEGTAQRLKAASATPGVVAGNDLEVAQKAADASRARVQAAQNSEKAAQAAVRALEEMEGYLRITAPFDGIITERNVHPGSLVGASGAAAAIPMLRIEQIARLRLVVAVPESEVGGIAEGGRVSFTVPAFPGETFQGVIRRVSHSLDVKTRTMPVELDVNNPAGRLTPGMFPEVTWPVKRLKATLFVPPSAVVTTTDRMFVIRVNNGKAEWVDVKRGAPAGDLIEVFGGLKAGDVVVRRGSDELRPGTPVETRGH